MLVNVVRDDVNLDLYSREQSTHYFLAVPPPDKAVYNLDIEVVGTIEVEEILSFGPTGEIETVKINGRTYNFAGFNPFANKVVFDDGHGDVQTVGI